MRAFFLFSFVVLIALFGAGCSVATGVADRGEKKVDYFDKDQKVTTRVLLQKTSTQISVQLNKDVRIKKGDRIIATLPQVTDCSISIIGKNVKFVYGDQVIESDYLTIESPSEDKFLSVGLRKYRGVFELRVVRNELLLVNRLSLDDYVRSVVPLEMGLKEGKYFEALKAAAVSARTYAVMKIMSKNEGFDLYNDTRDQVYGGFTAETAIDDRAVDETRNQILTYNGQPATVFYYSSCGGVTEDVGNVFTLRGVPYLRSINDVADGDTNCKNAPVFSWQEKISPTGIVANLVKEGYVSNSSLKIVEFEIAEKYESGRVKLLKITFDDKSIVTIPGKDIRRIIRRNGGKDMLRSTLFTLDLFKSNGVVESIIINGRGYGHGVGLCQWGSFTLSSNGHSYEDILKFYYPGTKVSIVK